jgi:hypothetical protein
VSCAVLRFLRRNISDRLTDWFPSLLHEMYNRLILFYRLDMMAPDILGMPWPPSQWTRLAFVGLPRHGLQLDNWP